MTYTQREWRGRSGAFASSRKRKNLSAHDARISKYEHDRSNVPSSKVSDAALFMVSLRAKYLLYKEMVEFGTRISHRRLRHSTRIKVDFYSSLDTSLFISDSLEKCCTDSCDPNSSSRKTKEQSIRWRRQEKRWK